MRKLIVSLVGLFIGATLVCAASVSAQQASAIQGQGQTQSQIGGLGSASAISDQNQGQVQSQSSAGGAVLNSGNSAVSFSNSFNGSEPIRSLPIPQAAAYDTRGGPAYFGRPNYQSTGPNFMSMNNLVSVLNHMDLNEIEANDEGDIELVGQLLNALDDEEILEVDGASAEENKPTFSLNSDADVMSTAGGNFRPIAVVTLKATDNNSMNSASLAVALASYAKEVRGNRIVLIQEGVVKKLSSFGVGIGLASNYATVGSDGNDVGSTGAGGTGWSWGEAQYFSLPYLTAVIGRE